MLDLKIYTFLKVVETRSYTAAAEALHMTQPAVTQHIRRLEEHYGCKLIAFSGRSFQLTPGGQALCEYAALQMANEKLLTARIAGLQTPFRIGATLSIADYYLPAALNGYMAEEHRGVNVTVANTKVLLSGLVRGQLDCAFIEGNFDRELFESAEFCRARFLPAASASHPLAGKAASLKDILKYPLLLREPGSGTRDILEHSLRQQNEAVSSFAGLSEMSSFVLMKKLLRGSPAVSFMYEAVAREEVARGTLCFLELQDYRVVHPLHFVCLKNGLQKKEAWDFYRHIGPQLESGNGAGASTAAGTGTAAETDLAAGTGMAAGASTAVRTSTAAGTDMAAEARPAVGTGGGV